MKGIIFNLLEQVVSTEYGEDAWEKILEDAGVSGAYTSLGNYDDADLLAMLEAASAATGRSEQELLRWFGRNAIPLLAQAHPHFFEPHDGTKAFLLTLNDIIHSEVRKLYPGAHTPSFDFEDMPDGLRLRYVSKRRMCSLAEGFIEGAGDHYEEGIEITQSACMLDGDEECRLDLTIHAPGAAR